MPNDKENTMSRIDPEVFDRYRQQAIALRRAAIRQASTQLPAALRQYAARAYRRLIAVFATPERTCR